jgi:hypothetical protein
LIVDAGNQPEIPPINGISGVRSGVVEQTLGFEISNLDIPS